MTLMAVVMLISKYSYNFSHDGVLISKYSYIFSHDGVRHGILYIGSIAKRRGSEGADTFGQPQLLKRSSTDEIVHKDLSFSAVRCYCQVHCSKLGVFSRQYKICGIPGSTEVVLQHLVPDLPESECSVESIGCWVSGWSLMMGSLGDLLVVSWWSAGCCGRPGRSGRCAGPGGSQRLCASVSPRCSFIDGELTLS